MRSVIYLFILHLFVFVRSSDRKTIEATDATSVASSETEAAEILPQQNLSEKQNKTQPRLAQIHLLLNADSVWFFTVKTNKPLSVSMEADPVQQ